eukprot:1159200-Pelagomonas_calceolata.AAC.4
MDALVLAPDQVQTYLFLVPSGQPDVVILTRLRASGVLKPLNCNPMVDGFLLDRGFQIFLTGYPEQKGRARWSSVHPAFHIFLTRCNSHHWARLVHKNVLAPGHLCVDQLDNFGKECINIAGY